MVVIYFSGTGNSEYIARGFARRMDVPCYSIEENLDFKTVLGNSEIVVFCYPIYGSCVPRLLREFAASCQNYLQGKKFVILCTQMMFSGDGAKAMARLLPEQGRNVVYAEHFNMPNNISNFWLFPIRDKERIRKIAAAEKKLDKVCSDINKGVKKLRGWGRASFLLGKIQSAFWPEVEKKKQGSFKAESNCSMCGLCVKLCPVNNLESTQQEIKQNSNCMLCYRCVNACPEKAAVVLIDTPPKRQYKGPV